MTEQRNIPESEKQKLRESFAHALEHHKSVRVPQKVRAALEGTLDTVAEVTHAFMWFLAVTALVIMAQYGEIGARSVSAQGPDQPGFPASTYHQERLTSVEEIAAFFPELHFLNTESITDLESLIQFTDTAIPASLSQTESELFLKKPTPDWLAEHQTDLTDHNPTFYRQARAEYLNPNYRVHDLYVSKQLLDNFNTYYQATVTLLRDNGIIMNEQVPTFSDFIGVVFANINFQLNQNGVGWQYSDVNIIVVDDSLLQQWTAVSADLLYKDKTGWWPGIRVGNSNESAIMYHSLFADTESSLSQGIIVQGVFDPNYIDIFNGILVPSFLMTTMLKDVGLTKSWTDGLNFAQLKALGIEGFGYNPNLFSPANRSATIFWKGVSDRLSPIDRNFMRRFQTFSGNPMADMGYNPMLPRRNTMTDGTVASVYNSEQFDLRIWKSGPADLMPAFLIESPDSISEVKAFTTGDSAVSNIHTPTSNLEGGTVRVNLTSELGSEFIVTIDGYPLFIPSEMLRDMGFTYQEAGGVGEVPKLFVEVDPEAYAQMKAMKERTFATIYLYPHEQENFLTEHPGLLPYAHGTVGDPATTGYEVIWVAFDRTQTLSDIALNWGGTPNAAPVSMAELPALDQETTSSALLKRPIMDEVSWPKFLDILQEETAALSVIRADSTEDLTRELWLHQGYGQPSGNETTPQPDPEKTNTVLILIPESMLDQPVGKATWSSAYPLTYREMIAFSFNIWLATSTLPETGEIPVGPHVSATVVAVSDQLAESLPDFTLEQTVHGPVLKDPSGSELILPPEYLSLLSMNQNHYSWSSIDWQFYGDSVSLPLLNLKEALTVGQGDLYLDPDDEQVYDSNSNIVQLRTLINGWPNHADLVYLKGQKFSVGWYQTLERQLAEQSPTSGSLSYQFSARLESTGEPVTMNLLTLGDFIHSSGLDKFKPATLLFPQWEGDALESPLNNPNLVAELQLPTGEKYTLPFPPLLNLLTSHGGDNPQYQFTLTVNPRLHEVLSSTDQHWNDMVVAVMTDEEIRQLETERGKFVIATCPVPAQEEGGPPLNFTWYLTQNTQDIGVPHPASTTWAQAVRPIVYEPIPGKGFLSWLRADTVSYSSEEQVMYTKDYFDQFIDVETLQPGQDLTRQLRTFRGASALWYLAYIDGDPQQRTELGNTLIQLRYTEVSPEQKEIYRYWQMYYNQETESGGLPTERGVKLLYLGTGNTRNFTESDRTDILTDFAHFLENQGFQP